MVYMRLVCRVISSKKISPNLRLQEGGLVLEVPPLPALPPLGLVALNDVDEVDARVGHDVLEVDGAGAADAEQGEADHLEVVGDGGVLLGGDHGIHVPACKRRY